MVQFSIQLFQTGQGYFLVTCTELDLLTGEVSRYWHQQTLMIAVKKQTEKKQKENASALFFKTQRIFVH